MKKISIYYLSSVVVMFFIASCSSDGNDPITAPVVDTTPIINTVKTGTWRVTKYVDHTKDETEHFAGYNFTFGDNDVLTASNGTNTYIGVWSVTNNVSGLDDSPEDGIDFNIAFVTPPDFEDISDDWDIVSRTDTKIELVDDKKNSTSIDYITFEKN